MARWVQADCEFGRCTTWAPGKWHPVGRPEYLRQCVEMSLRRLNVETIDLYQLHRIDPQVPLEDQLGALADMQTAGKIRPIGFSEVAVELIQPARQIAPIVSVQNLYSLVNAPPSRCSTTASTSRARIVDEQADRLERLA